MHKKYLPACLLLLCAALLSGCFKSSKTVVHKVGVDENNIPLTTVSGKPVKMDGVFYALPLTVIKVRVHAKREDKIPGEFPQFAKCFLPPSVAEKAITQRDTSFSLGTPEFEERGVPDMDEVYVINIKGGYFEDKALTLALTQSGVFASADATSEDKSVDAALAVLDTAVDLGTGIAGIRSMNRNAKRRLDTNADVEALLANPAWTKDLLTVRDRDTAYLKLDPSPSQLVKLTPEENTCYEKMQEQYLREKVAKAKYKKEVEDTLSSADNQRELQKRVNERLDEEMDDSLGRDDRNKFRASVEKEERAKLREEIREAIKRRWLGKLPDNLSDSQREAALQELVGVAAELNRLKLEVKDLYGEAKKRYEEIEEKQKQVAALTQGLALPNTQADALKLALDRLNADIEALQQRYFLGVSRSDDWTGNFEYAPPTLSPDAAQKPGDAKLKLFTFSAKGGICALHEAQGNKVKPSFKVAERCADEYKDEQKEVALYVTRADAKGQLAKVISGGIPSGGNDGKERGFYYRVPGVALVRLFVGDAFDKDGKVLDANEKARKAEVQVAQYGTTASLPAGTGGRKTKYVLGLYESSGGMKNFTLGSDALVNKAQIQEVNSTMNSALDAKAKRQQAEIDAVLESRDELKRLKRQREMLEEKNKIEAEKKKLQGSTP